MVNLTYAGFANLVYDISKKLSDDGKLFQVHFTKQGDSPLKDFASTATSRARRTVCGPSPPHRKTSLRT